MRQIDYVFGVGKRVRIEERKRFAIKKICAVVDVFIAARPETENLDQIARCESNFCFSLKHDLLIRSRRRWCCDCSARGSQTTRDVFCKLKHNGCSGGTRRRKALTK